jgi:hypothetical protein
MTTDKLLKHLTNTAIPTAAPIEITDAQDISTWQHQTMTFTGVWSAGKRSQKYHSIKLSKLVLKKITQSFC